MPKMPKMPKMLWLSYTMAKRYERCGELARAWKHKEVSSSTNDRPFIMGRVVHAAFEEWLLSPEPRPSLQSLYEQHWPTEETNSARILWKGVTDRQEVYAEGHRVCGVLEADAIKIDLTQMRLEPEVKFRANLNAGLGLGMYGQADILAHHPDGQTTYLVELKSGKTFARDQVAWYAGALSICRQREGKKPGRIIGLSLRPALTPSVEILHLTEAEVEAQIERATNIGQAIQSEQWDPKPGSYCSICEARTNCPAYQRTFGSISTGVVSLA